MSDERMYEVPGSLLRELRVAEIQRDRAVAALRFYADGATWNGPPDPPPIRFDLGHRAQTALAELEES